MACLSDFDLVICLCELDFCGVSDRVAWASAELLMAGKSRSLLVEGVVAATPRKKGVGEHVAFGGVSVAAYRGEGASWEAFVEEPVSASVAGRQGRR